MCIRFMKNIYEKILMEVYLTTISICCGKNDIKSITLGTRITKNLDFNNHLTFVVDPILTFFSNEFL